MKIVGALTIRAGSLYCSLPAAVPLHICRHRSAHALAYCSARHSATGRVMAPNSRASTETHSSPTRRRVCASAASGPTGGSARWSTLKARPNEGKSALPLGFLEIGSRKRRLPLIRRRALLRRCSVTSIDFDPAGDKVANGQLIRRRSKTEAKLDNAAASPRPAVEVRLYVWAPANQRGVAEHIANAPAGLYDGPGAWGPRVISRAAWNVIGPSERDGTSPIPLGSKTGLAGPPSGGHRNLVAHRRPFCYAWWSSPRRTRPGGCRRGGGNSGWSGSTSEPRSEF
jgi:hypothetical protein